MTRAAVINLFWIRSNPEILIASLRCLDTFVKIDGRYFSERNLVRDWSETRPST
jgi:hypothetical protein